MKKNVYIFDIDGTLADCSHRLSAIQMPAGLVHFDPGETDWKPDWDKFYSLCDKDEPIEDVCRVCRELHLPIIYITGRSYKTREKTAKWLKDNDLPNGLIFFRGPTDYRPDYIVKHEIYERHIKDRYNVLGVFEDRDQVVQMWRALGLTCFQVANGNY